MPKTRGRLPNLGSKLTTYFQAETSALTDIGTGNVTLVQVPNILVPANAKVILKAWTNMVINDTPRQFQFARETGATFDSIGQATLTDNVQASRLTHYQDEDSTGITDMGTGFIDLHQITDVEVEDGDIVLLMASDVLALDSTTARNVLFGRNAVQVGRSYRCDNSSGSTTKTMTQTMSYVDTPGAGTYTYNVATVNGSATDDFVEGNMEIFVIKQNASLASKTNHAIYIDEPVAGEYTYTYYTFNGNANDDIGDRYLEVIVLQE